VVRGYDYNYHIYKRKNSIVFQQEYSVLQISGISKDTWQIILGRKGMAQTLVEIICPDFQQQQNKFILTT
jgi:hypothetical protein